MLVHKLVLRSSYYYSLWLYFSEKVRFVVGYYLLSMRATGRCFDKLRVPQLPSKTKEFV